MVNQKHSYVSFAFFWETFLHLGVSFLFAPPVIFNGFVFAGFVFDKTAGYTIRNKFHKYSIIHKFKLPVFGLGLFFRLCFFVVLFSLECDKEAAIFEISLSTFCTFSGDV